MSNLNPKQFWFHSTHEDLPEGSVLQPGQSRDVNNFPTDKGANNKNVWIEPKAHLALGWGSQAARSARKDTAHVYEVQPLEDPVKKGNKGWTTTSATVVKRVASVPAVPYSLKSAKEALK
jgi:hypothetical protein